MAINTGRVIAGGLAGGVVANAVDFVTNNYVLAPDWQAWAASHNIDAAALTSGAVAGTWTSFGIPHGKILAAGVEVHDGIVTDRLTRIPSGDGKPAALRSVLPNPPDAAFGNSKWDVAMLAMAKLAFAVNPFPDMEDVARRLGWRIYYPDPIEL
jgi:hypothetical protein